MTAEETLLILLRQALNDATSPEIPDDVDWQKVIDLSFDQGVDAISVDGYHKWLDKCGGESLLETDESLEDLKFEWFGSVLQAEEDYRSQWSAAVSMTDIFASEHIRTFVLKGFAVGRLYPIPEHRVCGDCDIWLGEDYEKGNSLMEREGVEVDRSFYKNSTYHYKGLTVENHCFCSPIRGGRRKKEYERYLQSIIADGAVKIGNSQMWSPGPLFNALFLTSHAMVHFVVEGGITLRHVIDWTLALEELQRTSGAQGMKIYEDRCREFGSWKFARALRDRDERLMNEILHPSVPKMEPTRGLKARLQLISVMYKSRWKYKLYTNSSFTTEFFRMALAFIFERNPRLEDWHSRSSPA